MRRLPLLKVVMGRMDRPYLANAGPDADVISVLHSLCFHEPLKGRSIQALLSNDRCFALLGGCDKDGRPASFVICRVIGAESELLWLGVKPERQRRGSARILMLSALDEACGRGAETMVLEVAENNLRACCLYESLGFVIVGRRPRYYRQATGELLDAKIMQVSLEGLPRDTQLRD